MRSSGATERAIERAIERATESATERAIDRAIDDAIKMCTNATQKLILAEFKKGMRRTQEIANDRPVSRQAMLYVFRSVIYHWRGHRNAF